MPPDKRSARVCSSCSSSSATNRQSIEIAVPAYECWRYLSDVKHLKTVHEPVFQVEVIEDSISQNMRITRWLQYADWGRRKKVEEILMAAVFDANGGETSGQGHVDNVSVRRVDFESESSEEIMHFSHRFLIKALAPNKCILSEEELLETHQWQIDACTANTAKKHELLFANIKRELEAASGCDI